MAGPEWRGCAFDFFFNGFAKPGGVYVALELANADALENAYINHQESNDYLLNSEVDQGCSTPDPE